LKDIEDMEDRLAELREAEEEAALEAEKEDMKVVLDGVTYLGFEVWCGWVCGFF
jgi:cytochrome b involved in lipid metabolism